VEYGVNKLEQMITQQNETINALKDKIELLEDKILRLSICKLSNENYPYYDFILSYNITPDQQTQIARLFTALSQKLSGNLLPPSLKKSESYSTEFLFNNSPIRYDDVRDSILKIWPIMDDSLPLALIIAMHEQGLQIEVCEYLISQSKKRK
jgi:hypothetical protein